MPCNGVATVAAKLAVSLQDMMTVPGAVDALTALCNQTLQVQQVRVQTYGIEITLRNGEYLSIDNEGRIYAQSPRLRDAVKGYLEELSQFLLVQVAAMKVREVARVQNESYLDGGAIVMQVEI